MREEETAVDMLVRMKRELDELKTKQMFGGDALHLHEFNAILPLEPSVEMRLTLTPTDPKVGCLPSKAELRWTNPSFYSQLSNNYFINPIYREDGVFQWDLSGANLNQYDTYVTLQYLGEGTVDLVRLA